MFWICPKIIKQRRAIIPGKHSVGMKEQKFAESQLTCHQTRWPFSLLWLSDPLYVNHSQLGEGLICPLTTTQKVTTPIFCRWPVLWLWYIGLPNCRLFPWLLLTIKILDPEVICWREGAAALGVLRYAWDGLSASVITHSSCWRTSHSKWCHIGNGEPASTVICTVICMIEFLILSEENGIFI